MVASSPSTEALLVNILDPNRYVDPSYVQYIVIERSGRTHTGMIASESPSAITLRRGKNDQIDIRRRIGARRCRRADQRNTHDLGMALGPRRHVLEEPIDPGTINHQVPKYRRIKYALAFTRRGALAIRVLPRFACGPHRARRQSGSCGRGRRGMPGGSHH